MFLKQDDAFTCPMCGRLHASCNMEWHHLLPKDGESEKEEPRIYVCKTCHDVIHYCHTNKELRTQINTLALLLLSEKIEKMILLYKYDKKNNKVYKIKKLKQMRNAA